MRGLLLSTNTPPRISATKLPRLPARGRYAALSWLLLALAALVPISTPAHAQDPIDPIGALNEGNRLFRDGQIEEAVEAYRSGYDPASVHPTLVYNLGTALHHLDRLPEAILWYRRGDPGADPWLEENLWLARRSLGSQTLPPAGILGTLAGLGNWIRGVAIVLAWLGLGLLLLGGRLRWAAAVTFVLASLLYGSVIVSERWGAHPAVLLADCETAAGQLPAGTEAWVRKGSQDSWQIVARSAQAVCPRDAVALVYPSQR